MPSIHELFKRHRCEWMTRSPGSYTEEIVKEFYISMQPPPRVSLTQADNVVTWDRTVMVAALVAGFEMDFARLIIAEVHERAFKSTTTYSIPCLLFHLCRDSGVPVWHYDKLIQATKTLDISLIRDEANVVAPRRDLQVEVAPLGADLVADVEQM
uniref:Integrase core domain containing protein n=1 Tax=Solanum tuberosum TaxID=4113 RepID=M1DN58_SOLTU